jgi:RimJ/RimL family protein N-acetyltransferase
VALSAETLVALADGRSDWAATQPELGGAEWPAEDRRVLRYRSEALAADPASARFLLHAIVERGRVVGRIGAHGAPDERGEVEIGYFVRTEARGAGVAGWAVDAFLEWLSANGASSVLASVRPDNEASLRLLRRRGFEEVGTRIDDEDGLELVLRRTLG